MSYLIKVWTENNPERKKEIFSNFNLVFNKKINLYESNKDGSQISVECLRVEPEDVPEVIIAENSKIKYLADINIEPINASKYIIDYAFSIAISIAKESNGIIQDDQVGKITFPSGVSKKPKITPIPEKKPHSELVFSWWFLEDSPILNKEGFKVLFEKFKSILPEALPRRYDVIEPPKYKIEKEGEDHFLSFFEKNKFDSPVWYPYKPVLDVWFSVKPKPGFRTMLGGGNMFSSNYASISFKGEVLNDGELRERLQLAWIEISKIINPFYGDARVIYSLIDENGYVVADKEQLKGLTTEHPIHRFYWNGIPRKLGMAAVIGEPYLSLWSEVKSKAYKLDNNLAFLSTKNWNLEHELSDAIGPVPSRIAQVPKSNTEKYPLDFPFK
jgi:hypothetical protein